MEHLSLSLSVYIYIYVDASTIIFKLLFEVFVSVMAAGFYFLSENVEDWIAYIYIYAFDT